MYGNVTGEAVGVWVRKRGIEPPPRRGYQGRRHTSKDGHYVRSRLELRVDNWLFRHKLDHEYEPRLPFPFKNKPWLADFKVGAAYIEIWGLSKIVWYQDKMKRKKALYTEHGLHLVELDATDFEEGRWKEILKAALLK